MDTIKWARDQDLLNAGLLGVKPALLYVVTRGRNAWNSTWVTNYSGPSALLGSRRAAENHAEGKRVQGSVFTIREVPGLALQTDQGPLGMVEFHSRDCFGKWDPRQAEATLAIGTPISTVLHNLGPAGLWRKPEPSKHSFITGKAAWHSLRVLPPKRPLKKWESRSDGPNHRLGWLEQPFTYSRQGVNKIRRIFEELNPEADRLAAEQRYWAAAQAAADEQQQALRDATVRTETLLAQPTHRLNQP